MLLNLTGEITSDEEPGNTWTIINKLKSVIEVLKRDEYGKSIHVTLDPWIIVRIFSLQKNKVTNNLSKTLFVHHEQLLLYLFFPHRKTIMCNF